MRQLGQDLLLLSGSLLSQGLELSLVNRGQSVAIAGQLQPQVDFFQKAAQLAGFAFQGLLALASLLEQPFQLATELPHQRLGLLQDFRHPFIPGSRSHTGPPCPGELSETV